VRRQRPDIQERLCALARQYELVALYAFGSRAIEIAARVSGEEVESAHPSSDADIGVLPARGRCLTARERVELLCATDLDAEAEYQLYVLRRAEDLAPFERERWRMILSEEAI
jgi:hypothetical protein